MPSSLDLIPLCSGRPDFFSTWAKICHEGHHREQAYIAALRQRGIKAAHPNDGWIKRDEQKLHFAYPHFNDGAKTGDLVALGYEFDATTLIVRLTTSTSGVLSSMKWWSYTPVETLNNKNLIP